MELKLSTRQMAFVSADADEVLFGGAAGGGKSYAQVADALIYAARYKGSRQLLLRRTFPELERSLIRTARELYPTSHSGYNATRHLFSIAGGSTIEFGCCESEGDVYRYQSAEYDCIRFDELTHFTEYQYRYLSSRNRGMGPFPRQIKSTGNPGGIGHSWVKARFITPAVPDRVFLADGERRLFIPAGIRDNPFLMRADPGYARRLMRLPEMERRALLEGDWELSEGQFFTEFRRERHVCEPFEIPRGWRRYRAIDYGLDMLACLWIALSPTGEAVVYRELCEPDLIISQAAKRIKAAEGDGEEIYRTLAPPDLWSRQRETGQTAERLFYKEGVRLYKAGNDRKSGWLALKEWLTPGESGRPKMRIFSSCVNLIAHLPALCHDTRLPGDCARQPHSITHAPDALRYFAISHTAPGETDTPQPLPEPLRASVPPPEMFW